MAVYMIMKKVSEDDEVVVYQFGPNEITMGEIEFHKPFGEITVIGQVNDGVISNESYENWAIQKLVRIYRKNNGVFPDRMAIEH